jgi:D-amino-acid oxidase
MKKIVIIGAGISGLSSAVKVAEYFRNEARVLLVSDAISPNTTGDGSAGLWTPYYCGKTDEQNITYANLT